MDHLKKSLEHAEEEIGEVEVPDEVSDVQCELCGRMMVIKARSLW